MRVVSHLFHRQISAYSGLRSIEVVPSCFVSIPAATSRRMRAEKARTIKEPVTQTANKTIAMILGAEHFRRSTHPRSKYIYSDGACQG